MSFSRNEFIETIRDRCLMEAFGLFMLRQVSRAIKRPNYWRYDIQRLLGMIPVMMDRNEIKTTFKDRTKALAEALLEATASQHKVLYAKNKVAGYYPELIGKIDRLDFDAEVEFRKMIKEFLPQYEELLPKEPTIEIAQAGKLDDNIKVILCSTDRPPAHVHLMKDSALVVTATIPDTLDNANQIEIIQRGPRFKKGIITAYIKWLSEPNQFIDKINNLQSCKICWDSFHPEDLE